MQSESSVKKYLAVFGALGVLTVLTVAVSYLKVSHSKAIAIALAIIAVKVFLISAFFMHLRYEKKTIVQMVFVALFLVLVLLLFTLPDFS